MKREEEKFEEAFQVIGIKANRQVSYVTKDQFVVALLLCKVRLVTGTLYSSTVLLLWCPKGCFCVVITIFNTDRTCMHFKHFQKKFKSTPKKIEKACS